jgi:hypothetical protein
MKESRGQKRSHLLFVSLVNAAMRLFVTIAKNALHIKEHIVVVAM